MIDLGGATGFVIEGVEVEAGIEIRGASDIAVRLSDIAGTFYLRDVSDLLIEDNRVHDGQYGIILNSIQNFVVRNNDISGATEDSMRVTGNSFGGLVEGNFIHHPRPSEGVHPDLIQLFGSNSPGTKYTPHDITIRQNHLYAPHDESGRGSAQGIFVTDPRTIGGYKNILIEENLIQVHYSNAICISGGQENVTLRNNTLMPNVDDGSAIIRLASNSNLDNSGTTVVGNVVKLIDDETRSSTIGNNYVYGRGVQLTWIFAGVDGRQWQSFTPVPRTRIDFGLGYGAETFLTDLLMGHARLGTSWTRR